MHFHSFDVWLVTAKEHMKWNDSCITLFWDMLTLATYYINYGSTLKEESDSSKHGFANHVAAGIELEYIAVFLILHVNEVQQRSSSPIVAYDTVWPVAQAAAGELDPSPTSPSSSPPGTHGSKFQKQKHPSSAAAGALSPKSPKTPSPHGGSASRLNGLIKP